MKRNTHLRQVVGRHLFPLALPNTWQVRLAAQASPPSVHFLPCLTVLAADERPMTARATRRQRENRMLMDEVFVDVLSDPTDEDCEAE